MTNVSREENGLANQETSTADQGQKKYKLNDLEALGNKASPRERCPRGQRRRCLAQPTAGKRAYPTAGKELELLVIKRGAIEKIVEIPSVVE